MARYVPPSGATTARSAPTRCGLWPGPRRITGVLLDSQTQFQLPLSCANTEQARTALLAWLAKQRAHLVIPDSLLGEPFFNQASHTPLTVWIAPNALVEAIRLATGLTSRPPQHTAALLARWPSVPQLRPFLRQFSAHLHPEQLTLF